MSSCYTAGSELARDKVLEDSGSDSGGDKGRDSDGSSDHSSDAMHSSDDICNMEDSYASGMENTNGDRMGPRRNRKSEEQPRR